MVAMTRAGTASMRSYLMVVSIEMIVMVANASELRRKRTTLMTCELSKYYKNSMNAA